MPQRRRKRSRRRDDAREGDSGFDAEPVEHGRSGCKNRTGAAYIRKTPNSVSSMGALYAAEIASESMLGLSPS